MMKFSNDPAIVALYARLGDLVALSERGEVGVTPYLTPREAMYAKSYLSSHIMSGVAYLWGGHPDAERVRAIIFPAYVEGMIPPPATPDDIRSPVDLLLEAGLDGLAQEVADLVAILRLQGSGFRNLTHRDYLGSVLGLGLERDVLGDIWVSDTSHAYVFCKGEICAFLQEHLTHVGHDPVKITRLDPATPVTYQRNTQPISDTVASPRLDCVVAALCNLSRDAAQSTLRSGLVEMNYETCDKCDATVEPPCIISVRGVGKFCVKTLGGETRKGRVRMTAEKFV